MVDSGYRQLIVMRHAKTEQGGSSDRARRLTSRGRSDARAAGHWLREQGLVPELLLTSPATRAIGTAELVVAALGVEFPARGISAPVVPIRTEEALYGANDDEVIALIAASGGDARTVLVVGHNPTMEELAYGLQAAPSDDWASHLPTAGVAVFRVPGSWADLALGSAELAHWHVARG